MKNLIIIFLFFCNITLGQDLGLGFNLLINKSEAKITEGEYVDKGNISESYKYDFIDNKYILIFENNHYKGDISIYNTYEYKDEDDQFYLNIEYFNSDYLIINQFKSINTQKGGLYEGKRASYHLYEDSHNNEIFVIIKYNSIIPVTDDDPFNYIDYPLIEYIIFYNKSEMSTIENTIYKNGYKITIKS
jgi:hypothetical protein